MGKTVATPHPLYKKYVDKWSKCRDAIEGEEAVKEQGTRYLPKLDGQDVRIPGSDHQHPGPFNTYYAYKQRAMFYAAAERTVKGLEGMVLRKEPDLTWPEGKKGLLKTVGVSGESFEEVISESIEETIGIGRFGILVDAPEGDQTDPYIATYQAESITCWEEAVIDGRRVPIQINLREQREIVNENGEEDLQTLYRVLRLGAPSPNSREEKELEINDYLALFGLIVEDFENGPIYYQEIWIEEEGKDQKKEFILYTTIIPRMNGGRLLNRIPFVFINSNSTRSKPNKPPILDLVNVNLSHYRNSADLEHGRHFTALPTAWASGFDPKQDLVIGSPVAWVTSDPGARAGYLEFSGQGLGHLQAGMDKKEKLMAVLGARLLEEQKAGVEAAEAVKLRHAGEQSSMAQISFNVSQGLTQCLIILARWLGISNPEKAVGIKLNKDFNLAGIEPDVLRALLEAVQGGAMSYDTFFWNLKRGEVIPDGTTLDKERKQIEEGLPASEAVLVAEEDMTPENEVEEPSEEDEEEDAVQR